MVKYTVKYNEKAISYGIILYYAVNGMIWFE